MNPGNCIEGMVNVGMSPGNCIEGMANNMKPFSLLPLGDQLTASFFTVVVIRQVWYALLYI